MKDIGKKIEITANIAIIAVAIMVGGVLVQKYVLSPKPQPLPSQPLPSVPIGTKLSLPDIDWAKNNRTLVLALQTGCHFCTESGPFYQRLVAEASNRNIPLIAVLPQSAEEGRKYLSDLNVAIKDVRRATLNSVGVRGTPTLLLVNSKGEVADGWIGKLQPDKESTVLKSLQ